MAGSLLKLLPQLGHLEAVCGGRERERERCVKMMMVEEEMMKMLASFRCSALPHDAERL